MELIGCLMLTQKILKIKRINESLPTAWELIHIPSKCDLVSRLDLSMASSLVLSDVISASFVVNSHLSPSDLVFKNEFCAFSNWVSSPGRRNWFSSSRTQRSKAQILSSLIVKRARRVSSLWKPFWLDSWAAASWRALRKETFKA